MAELAQETINQISQIQTQYGEGCDVKIIYEGSEDGTIIQNGPDILSVYAVRVTMKSANQNEVITLDDQKEAVLRDTYHQMVTVSYTIVEKESTESTKTSAAASTEVTATGTTAKVTPTPTTAPPTKNLRININCLSADEMIDPLGFTDEQVTMLQELTKPDYLLLFQSLLGIQNPAGLTQEEINSILANLPENLSIQQTQVIEKALSLVGKVSYFWGGKSNAISWDSRWGTSMIVTADGSDTTGTTRPFGLDCSGYVAWVYINCGLPAEQVDAVFGYSTATQWKYTTAIEWNQALIGDLVFFNVPGAAKGNHVGIIVGYDDDGNYLVAHCSSSRNCVVVSEAVSSGFHYVRRPVVWQK
ncbi:MAG TPA: NlpC/P60 family protein [Desulfuromonadaceae bacterium]